MAGGVVIEVEFGRCTEVIAVTTVDGVIELLVEVDVVGLALADAAAEIVLVVDDDAL
jgi:hypothetical protein